MARTLCSQCRGAWVQFLVRKPVHMSLLRSCAAQEINENSISKRKPQDWDHPKQYGGPAISNKWDLLFDWLVGDDLSLSQSYLGKKMVLEPGQSRCELSLQLQRVQTALNLPGTSGFPLLGRLCVYLRSRQLPTVRVERANAWRRWEGVHQNLEDLLLSGGEQCSKVTQITGLLSRCRDWRAPV